jgi:hypothetical protein
MEKRHQKQGVRNELPLIMKQAKHLKKDCGKRYGHDEE